MINSLEMMQDLYDSEINFRIDTFWDSGFDVYLGDKLNGYVANTNVDTWTEAVEYLRVKAIEYWPQSEFAKRYSD